MCIVIRAVSLNEQMTNTMRKPNDLLRSLLPAEQVGKRVNMFKGGTTRESSQFGTVVWKEKKVGTKIYLRE
jgi:hypothetical protein